MASQEERHETTARQLGEIEIKHSPTKSSQRSGSANQGSAQASSFLSSSTRVRRRNRMITSCLECRRRKLKCDKSHPCVNCTRGHRDCVFLAPALDRASQHRLTKIKEQASNLEFLLETDVARTSGNPTSSLGTEKAPVLKEDDPAPSPFVSVDAVYEDDGDSDDLLDLGIQVGKMRMTERIGGFVRPRVAEELEAALRPPTQTPSEGSQHSLRAQNAPHLMPGPTYIAPSPGFFFGQTIHVPELRRHLPSRQAADKLVEAYFLAAHPVAKLLHKPSFEALYWSFWQQESQGVEPPSSAQAIIFSVMFSGLVSMDDAAVSNIFAVHKDRFLASIKEGTEAALSRANFLRTTKIDTLLAFVMFLIPLCRGEVSRMHSVLVGSAIRLAECMGLHRDGEVYGMNPLETHTRRLIWHQLCLLDIRTCEAQGPRPGIRADEFDTRHPANVDDVDVRVDWDPPVDRERWTDTTLVRIRFEINEFMRFLWTERPCLTKRESTLTSVLTKMEAFRRNMNEKYDRLFDDRIPIQKHAKLLKTLLLSRLYVMVLAPYHSGPSTIMAPKLRQILIGNAVSLLECAYYIETLPELRPWAFWTGAYQQSHAAFLLLIDDTLFKPAEYTANINKERIWRCLDYVFQTDPNEPTDIKADKILRDIQKKTAEYQQLRKMRAPSSMVKHAEEHPRRRVDGSLAEAEPSFGASGSSAPRPPIDRRESNVSDIAPGLIGKAPIPNAFLESLTQKRALPAGTQQQYGLRIGPQGPMSVVPLASQLPRDPREDPGGPGGQEFAMPDIDWDVFDELYPVGGQDFSGQPPPPGFHPLNK